MKVEKNSRGWFVQPSTSDEEKALAFLFQALAETHGKTATTGVDDLPASQSRPCDCTPRMAAQAS